MRSLILASILLTVFQTPTTFQRGEVVRIKGENNMPTARIVALPGDRVRVDDSGVYVNGEAVAWISAEMRAHIPKPWQPEVMAEGQYFLVGSRREETNGTLIKGDYWAYTVANSFEKLPQ
jgi:signal peptidase I